MLISNKYAGYRLIKTKPLVVHRSPEGEWIKGRWAEESSEQLFTVDGHYYPLTANRKMMLPEASRTKSSYSMQCVAKLRTVDEGNNKTADKVEINGELYEVQSVEHFDIGNCQHYEYLLIRKEKSAGSTE